GDHGAAVSLGKARAGLWAPCSSCFRVGVSAPWLIAIVSAALRPAYQRGTSAMGMSIWSPSGYLVPVRRPAASDRLRNVCGSRARCVHTHGRTPANGAALADID